MERVTKVVQGKVLEIIELFDAKPERVFKALTNKKDFMSWYGPEGFAVFFSKWASGWGASGGPVSNRHRAKNIRCKVNILR
jgi:uncharacterized protein YndB with AHSA1/START domain